MRRLVRVGLVGVLLALVPATARAEWQLKPFGGITFGGDTTFVNLDQEAGKPKLNLGVSGLWQGEIFGLEGDVATTAGFFSGDEKLILKSHVATVTGNLVVAMPKRIAQYGLRPYGVFGFGMMDVGLYDNLAALPISSVLAAWDVGGGATGFLSDLVGLNWELRYFKSMSGKPISGQSVETEQLSFWRATMGISLRL